MPTENEGDTRAGAGGAPGADPVSDRVRALVDRGLEKYGAGDLLGALCEWEHALVLDPRAERAAEYIAYVRANFDELEEQFRSARAVEVQAAAQGVPIPEGTGEETEAYESVELEIETPDAGDATGWELDELVAPLPPPPQAAVPPDASALEASLGAPTILPRAAEPEVLAASDAEVDGPPANDEELTRPGGEEPPPLGERPWLSPEALEALGPAAPVTRDTPDPILPVAPGAATPPELELELGALDGGVRDDRTASEDTPTRPALGGGFAEEAPTIERRGPRPAGDMDSVGVAELDADPTNEFDEGSQTSERISLAAPGVEPPRSDPAVIVDDALLRAYDDAVERLAVEEGAARSEPPTEEEVAAEAVRARIQELLRVARESMEAEDHFAAVEAAEEAMSADPEGTIAPVILHRHRDLLFRVYEAHIGPLGEVPLVAVPLHEIAASDLDHRSGFLLSRIDGMLTFEEILDVAGMPRLEAYRLLSGLLRRGFIEVRSA